MKSKIRVFVFLLSCFLVADIIALAQGSGEMQTSRAERLTIPEREAVARPLLLKAESVARGLDSASRALLLYRTAGAWLRLDPTRTVGKLETGGKTNEGK